jgi:hypothetical protein
MSTETMIPRGDYKITVAAKKPLCCNQQGKNRERSIPQNTGSRKHAVSGSLFFHPSVAAEGRFKVTSPILIRK